MSRARTFVQRTSRARQTHRALFGTALLAIVSLLIGFGVSAPAYAIDYPSWDDVQAAKANEAATAAAVQNINGILVQVEAQAAAATAEAEDKGAIFMEAQQKFDAADIQSKQLAAQADEAEKKAKDAQTQAGRLAAQLYRSGGSELTTNLLLDGSSQNTEQLLSKLGNMSKLVERSTAIYSDAETALNDAQSLREQADIAKAARDKLLAQAQEAFSQAQAAQQAAQAALQESKTQKVVLEAQLAALADKTATTTAAYEAGVNARLAEEIARRKEDAANRGIDISDAGWTNPVPGAYVSDVYGPRDNFYIPGVGWTGDFHNATDLAAPCGTIIVAASSGQVTYAGGARGYGNLIVIDHGGGISTAYGHVQAIYVGWGEDVGVGQAIGEVGATGLATGCHTHFEVREGGQWSTVDPQPFMQDRGVYLGG